MIKTLVTKELRETAWIAALALVAYLAVVSSLVGMKVFLSFYDGSGELPFLGSSFSQPYVLISTALAIVLGFRQSAWEIGRGMVVFLFHRPISRRTIIATKLLTGIACYLLCAALPILIYGWWAATPGTHPSPFEWSMTDHAWRTWFALSLLYFGAFASGVRNARWFGSRLFPLVSSALIAFPLTEIPWTNVTLLITVFCAALFVSNTLWEAERRDY